MGLPNLPTHSPWPAVGLPYQSNTGLPQDTTSVGVQDLSTIINDWAPK